MNPLIGLAITLVPQLLQFFAGDKGGQIGKKVTDAVADVTKTRSTEEAIKKVNEDPKIKANLQAQLAQIALAAQRASYEDAQSERDAAYKADLLALQSTAGARQAALGFAASGPWNASAPAILSYTVVAGFLVILGFMSAGKLNPPNNDGLFQTMNILIGALAAAFATVLNFWLGSSLGSRRKDSVVEYQAAQPQQRAGGRGPPGDPGPPVELPKPGSMDSGPSGDGSGPRPVGRGPLPERAGSPGPLREIIPELVKTHRHFPNGVSWKLTPAGIAIDGAPPMGTPGEPATVRKIWNRYGGLCASFARQHGVPVELIVATIATESGGDSTARRPEPKIGDESVGLMQTLVGTARQALGRKNVSGDDLTDAATSIDAGTAYIAQQRKITHWHAPLVAAAYNAGSIRLDDSDRNRWKLLCYPRGTGHHVDKFVAFFTDCMKVSGAEHWGANNTPSFAAELPERTPDFPTEPSGKQEADKLGAGIPQRPSFRPLLLAEKQKIFGTFKFVADPRPDNHEHIKVTDDWVQRNIKKVSIPIKGIFGKPGPLVMDFHKLAEDQLLSLWLEWEKLGLLDRVLSFDGAHVARFIRGSTTTLSNHAFGTAFDINARFNPLGGRPAPAGKQGSVWELVPAANKFGFWWGGFYNSRLDGMHFEVAELQWS